MAIQAVKGAPRTAYVIRGNYKPQSYGQAWAQMASQQKYKLWEEAQRAAMQEMKYDQLDYQQKQDIYNYQLKELAREKSQTQKTIAGLEKLKLKGDVTSVTERTTPAYTTTSTGSGGGGTKSYRSQAEKDIERLDNSIYQTQSDLNSAEMKENLLSSNEALRTQAEADKAAAEDRIKNLKAQKRRRSLALGLESPREGEKVETLEQIYGGGEVATGGERTTYRPEVTAVSETTRPSGYDPEKIETEIAKLRAELQSLSEQESKLVAPELQRRNLIEETRRQYGQITQPTAMPTQTPSEELTTVSTAVSGAPRTITPNRLAELEALGADQDFIDQYLGVPEQPVELTETPRFMGEPTIDPELARTQARERLEREYQPSPLTRVVEGYAGQPLDVVDQAVLREESPTFEEIRQDRALAAAQREQDILDRQLASRQEAELARSQFPELESLTEQQKRLQTAVSPFGALAASYYPPVSERDLEFQAMQMEGPVATEQTVEKPKYKGIESPQIKYKDEVFDAGTKMPREEVQKMKTSQDKPEWAKITEGLFNPPANATQEKIDELLQNAWEEITLTYSDDRETMKKAHSYLIALDNNLETKPE